MIHAEIYLTHSTVWLTAAKMCEETQVFPKLNLLTNHRRLVLDIQIIMPRAINMRTLSACRERQWHSARCIRQIDIFVHVTGCPETMPMSSIVKKPCSILKTKRSTKLKTGQQKYVKKWLLPHKGKNLLILVFSDVTWKPRIDPPSCIRHLGFHYFLGKSRNSGNWFKIKPKCL